MHEAVAMTTLLDGSVSRWIGILALAIEVFAALVITAGLVWATVGFAREPNAARAYHDYKVRVGSALLLGLEVVVAADIVKTIAVELTPMGLVLLAGLVAIRSFLSWTLVLEIEGRWPWQAASRSRDDEIAGLNRNPAGSP